MNPVIVVCAWIQCKQEALIANSAELNLDSPCYFKTKFALDPGSPAGNAGNRADLC